MAAKQRCNVQEARAAMLARVQSLEHEQVPLSQAAGRILAAPVIAERDQPPFSASAMDGYAVLSADTPGTLDVVGESAAGRGYAQPVRAGQSVRISTGAPVPEGADAVAIKENVRRDGDRIEALHVASGTFIRPRGGDFRKGDLLLPATQRLDGIAIALAAAAGVANLTVARPARIALLCCGDELVRPGENPGAYQIYDSASYGLAALIEGWGAAARRLEIQRDDREHIARAAQDGLAQSDLLVVIGGASVGDHDHARPALISLGLEIEVASVSLRPGKPTWFGVTPHGPVLGLPGNPASALVCAYLFLKPLLAKMQGGEIEPAFRRAHLEHTLPANGPREHYLRGRLSFDANGECTVRTFEDQDSSLLSVFAAANALIRLPPYAPAFAPGALVDVLTLDRQ